MRLPASNPYLSQVLSRHADELLKGLEDTRTMRGRVEGLLISKLHTGSMGLSVIAAGMGLSGQTLFRRLKAEGATFAHKCRTEFAEAWRFIMPAKRNCR